MAKNELFINAIQMIPVEGSVNTPTVLLYRPDGAILIGSSAITAASRRQELNEDFKIDLGNVERRSSSPVELFSTATGKKRSAVGLTADFLRQLVNGANEWLAENNASGVSAMLAEPLSLQVGLVPSDWLSNYRQNLQGILTSKVFQSIDFLPEPFAVFQYYRYGLRHPLVAQRAKHNALVIDFGGGTCDVCIIETTKEGDISQSGRNSRPLAATSESIGGFFVNKMLAEELFRTSYPRIDKSLIRTGLDLHRRWRSGENLSHLETKYKTFIDNFHALIYEIESPKLTICKSIVDWGLEAPCSVSVPVSLPEDPFVQGSKTISRQLTAQVFREVFIKRVWEPSLRQIIKRTLQRGQAELSGAPISVILLSGGSANIGWLSKLIVRDLGDQLQDAPILHLPDFQEVVAKGLAVECARRFYDPNGDFSAVTYNRLNLIIEPDDAGWQVRQFKPKTEGLPTTDIPGVLLPSASVLKDFIGIPMTWKVQLSRAPHRKLGYRFLRSSFNPEDIDNLQNVEERTLDTPPNIHFDPSLQIQLLVTEDGTAHPQIIYANGSPAKDGTLIGRHVKECRPFCLDMTYSKSGLSANAYVGLDFGTSNTSISYVSAQSIQVYLKRAAEKSWRELSELVSALPYPVADPLGRYLGQGDPLILVKRATEFLESALALAAYVAFMDYCSQMGKKESRFFKGFTQRSAGPLWHFLQDCLSQLGSHAVFSAGYAKLLSPELFEPINVAVDFVAKFKHDKASETEIDTLRPVQILANVTHEVFSQNAFGYFDQVHKQKFTQQYEGVFRVAKGVPPFLTSYGYSGPDCFSEDEAFLVNLESGKGVSLQPLIFWDYCPKHPDTEAGHCFLYDRQENEMGEYAYKAVGYPCVCIANNANSYKVLAAKLGDLRTKDQRIGVQNFGAIEELS